MTTPSQQPSQPPQQPPYDGGAAEPDLPAAEDRVRHALREAVRGVEPSPWQPAEVRERAAGHRRARRLAATLPVVAAVAACAVVMAAANQDRGPDSPTRPPAPTGPTAPDGRLTADHPPATPVMSAPAVRVVAPGQPFAVGDGEQMRLEPTRVCLLQRGAAWQCDNVAGDNRSAGSVSSENRADQHGTVYAPLYTGPVPAARMTLTVQGRDYPVQLVVLAGPPGYAAGYVVGPPPPSPGVFPGLTIRVYDAGGAVLATLVSPAGG
ncbi:hypothetical protein [Streptacidiphilus cavernicola]|uniref:Uncharacterized protein n=1 Tax=Streptacidiphilus cavernicola TaxID=3342716 RepID=A0ABV6VZC4_9ACTN